jgi:hypothetical protein
MKLRRKVNKLLTSQLTKITISLVNFNGDTVFDCPAMRFA